MDEEEVRKIIQEELANILGIDRFTFQKHIQIFNARNIQLGKDTGTKIGTETTQKLGFFNATPVIQQSATGTSQGFTAGVGTGVNDDSTFTGDTGSAAYRISDIVKHLKNLGLIAS